MNHRAPRERDPEYCAWVAKLPCVICMWHGKYNPRVHVAHVRFADAEAGWRNIGMQEKPSDARTLPLCPPHHTGDVRVTRDTQHHQNERAFYANHGIDAPALCRALNAAYAAGKPGAPIITLAAARGRRTLEDAPR